MEEIIQNPIGCRPLKKISQNKQQAIIIFDDISRGTPTKELAQIILEELHSGGLNKDQIRFICAQGAHGAHTREQFVKKLGSRIVEEYPVFNHNTYEGCVYVGKTSKNTPIWVNKEVMECDLKIGIGAITPHVYNGFGGGCKIVLPGVAGIDTIEANHRIAIDFIRKNHLNPVSGLGRMDNDEMRKDIEEAVRLVGLDFKVDAILNTRLEIIDLFAGDPIDEYYAGIPRALELYGVDHCQNKDICIVNANAKATEAAIAMYMGAEVVKPGGSLIIINNTPEGQVTHYLLGPLGKSFGGRMWKGPSRLSKIKQIIILSEYPDYLSGLWFCSDDRLKWAKSWEQVIEQLGNTLINKDVLVLVDGTLQFYNNIRE